MTVLPQTMVASALIANSSRKKMMSLRITPPSVPSPSAEPKPIACAQTIVSTLIIRYGTSTQTAPIT